MPLDDVVEVVEAVVARQHPAPVELVRGLGGSALDDVEVEVGRLVRDREHPLLHPVEEEAREDAHPQHGPRRPVDADPARLHGGDLVAPGQQAERDEDPDQHRDRGHEEGDLPEVEGVVVEDDAPLHLVLHDVVDEVHELAEHEDRHEGEEHEGDVPDPGPGDVAVEDGGEAQGEPRDADDDDRPRRGGGRCAPRGRGRARRALLPHPRHEGEVVRRIERVEGRLAVVQPEEADGDRREDDVGRPHREERGHDPVVAGLLAEPDEDVVDEDDADREGERRRARFLLAPEGEAEAEDAEHEARGGDRELLVPLDGEAPPVLAPLPGGAHLRDPGRRARRASSPGRPWTASASSGRGRTRPRGGPSPSSRRRSGCTRAGRAGRSCAGCPAPSSTRTIWRSGPPPARRSSPG